MDAGIWPSFSVVIPTFRRHQQLSECLSCLAPYFDPATKQPVVATLEVIVSDDANEPELASLLQQHYPWCRYTPAPGRGPAANRNHGARQATAEWLVFTDDDCLPQPGWLEAYAHHVNRSDVMEGRTAPAGRRTRVDEECPINEHGGYLWSCNFAINRVLFLQLGGFNEDFPAAAMEDVELNRRINLAGLKRQFVGTAEVRHPWRQRKGVGFVRIHSRSIATYVALHPETGSAFTPPVLFLNLLRSFKASLRTALVIGSLRGLPRQIGLDIMAAVVTWQALRHL
ncbi:MAG: glycosyltransferase family 2 protein [Sphaerospermopsis kisseleviana]